MNLKRPKGESDASYRFRLNKKWNKRAKEAAAMGQPIRVRNLPPAEKAKLRAMIDRILKK